MGRIFFSRDAVVRGFITQCSAKFPGPGVNACRATLECIINSVDTSTQGRWSAGAGILSFMPTIVALTSNSIDEVALVAEESILLAMFLGVCSSSVFTTRFGVSFESGLDSDAAILEDLDVTIPEALNRSAAQRKKRAKERMSLMSGAIALLTACCVAIWIASRMIWRNGVVIYSCMWNFHIPFWLALSQTLVLSNIVLRPCLYSREVIPMLRLTVDAGRKQRFPEKQPRMLQYVQKLFGPATSYDAWPAAIVLRTEKTTVVAHCIRFVTSVLTMALYAYSTVILAGMTM